MEGVGLKRFMATYIGTATAAAKAAWSKPEPTERAELEAKGMAAWGDWMARNAYKIADAGAPLGKTKGASVEWNLGHDEQLDCLCHCSSGVTRSRCSDVLSTPAFCDFPR